MKKENKNLVLYVAISILVVLIRSIGGGVIVTP